MCRYDGLDGAGPSRTPSAYARPKRRRHRLSSRPGKLIRWSCTAASMAVTVGMVGSVSVPPRWGQASVLAGERYFVVQGGHTNGEQGGGYTFTSGPQTSDTLLLDLSESFDNADAPWIAVNSTSSSQPPAVAFHSLSLLEDGSLFAYGGISGTSDSSGTATQSANSSISAYSAKLTSRNTRISWKAASSTWQVPQSRIFHSSECDGKGSVWIFGGEKSDGSTIVFDETWAFNATSASPAFTSETKPPTGLIGSTATMLSNGNIIVLGGADQQSNLQPFQTVTTYNPQKASWTKTSTAGSGSDKRSSQQFPSPRRNHIAVTLPDRRIFIHGGGNAQLSQAMDDAWILDWSVKPPKWTQITVNDGPSARFGHSAVAYGAKVAMSFGWAANNPADTSLYVFDASKMSNDGKGSWEGGQWSSSYSPDPSIASSKGDHTNGDSNNHSSPASSSSGGGSSTSGGSSDGTSDSGSSSDSGSGKDGGDNGGLGDGPNSDDGSSSGGNKAKAGTMAGAVVGSLLGLTALVGVGYYAYRKHQQPGDDWRHGDGAEILLRGSKHYDGPDQLMTEKDIEEGGEFQPGMHPMGPRAQRSEQGHWNLNNVGQAFEGSGPHFRQRLALFTGLGLGAHQSTQHRFDMLADEDEMETESITLKRRQHPSYIEEGDNDEFDGLPVHTKERSYGRLNQYDEQDYVYGDLGFTEGRGELDAYITSPFEQDRRNDRGAPDGLAAYEPGDLYDLDDRSEHETPLTASGPASSQTHTNASSNSTPSSVSKGSVHLSFSEAPGPAQRQKYHNLQADGSSSVRRSSTWWDRFKVQGFLERSSSGRLYSGPNAEDPIRDPAEPPTLDSIREASHSAEPTRASNPFENSTGADELGYVRGGEYASHSLSSLQSGRSSLLEARMRNMDVIQRAGTISSRRSASTGYSDGTSRSGSMHSSAHSRHPSLRDGAASAANHHGHTPVDSTPGSVVWDPHRWGLDQIPGTVEEQEEGDETREDKANESQDIADTSYGSHIDDPYEAIHEKSYKPTLPDIHDSHSSTHVESHTPQRAHMGHVPKEHQLSESPSLTPSTTKRARNNAELTSPLSPVTKRTRSPPTQGSVKDRVKAIERKWTDEGPAALLPMPRSPAFSTHSGTSGENTDPREQSNNNTNVYVPGRGGKPILTKLDMASASQNDTVSSPTRLTSAAGHGKIRHGLVPKAQLYVANPDNRRGSSSSG